MQNITQRISIHDGALILIEMLYQKRQINQETYDNFQKKYKFRKSKNDNKMH